MFLGFGTIMAAAFYLSNHPADQNLNIGQVLPQDSIYTLTVNVTPEEQQQQHIEQSHERHSDPGSSSSSGLSSNVSDSASVETGTTTDTHVIAINTASPGTGEGTSNTVSTGSTISVDQGLSDSEPVIIPDSAPEFEGGLSALYRFLGSKLKYPEPAREIGKQGTVFVKFVVDQNGKVGNLKLLNNLGYGLDEEALRVVSLIPNFKTPGKVGGKAVKVYYQLPIKFTMN